VVARLLGVDRFLYQSGHESHQPADVRGHFRHGRLHDLVADVEMGAKASVGATVIEQPRTQAEQWLVETVRRQAQGAGIGMPEVAIYDSPEPNAFATGANRNSALVAVSTGLLEQMSAEEVEAVLGHEVSHVANGDMVTLALLQGCLTPSSSPVTGSWLSGRSGAVAGPRSVAGSGIGYPDQHGHGNAVRLPGFADRDVVQSLTGISRRRGRGQIGRSRQDDRGAGAVAAIARTVAVTHADGGVRHQRAAGAWPAQVVDDASTVGRTHRRAASQG
jgi:hypothetical protein